MEESKDLHLLGVSFRTAPASVREALSFSQTEAAALLQAQSTEWPSVEALVLSTCNRSEFYLAASRESSVVEGWLAGMCRTRPQAPILRTDCFRYHLHGVEAVRHLFRVACGLDSAILGDVQILGQVKDAMSVAAEAHSLGRYLQRAASQAIRAGKRARSETTIGRGAASIGSALAGMLAERLPTVGMGQRPQLLILGAGEAARDIGRHVAKYRLWNLTFINRTDQRAIALAQDCGGHSRPWSALNATLLEADIVITATTASQPILQRTVLDEQVSLRPHRPFLVIDAGLPRNVEPGSAATVIDIDAIRERQDAVLAQRHAAVPDVEQIVEAEVRAWEHWSASLPLEGLIKVLYREVDSCSRDVAQHLLLPGDVTFARTEQVMLRAMKRLLHGHVRRLRHLVVPSEVRDVTNVTLAQSLS